MDDMFMQNVFYCMLFVVSGLIILRSLRKRRMYCAHFLGVVLFLLLSMYIPFYFLGRLSLGTMEWLLEDPGAVEIFSLYMTETLAAPFLFVKGISVGTAIFAFIFTIAGLLTTVFVIRTIVEYIRRSAPYLLISRRARRGDVVPAFSYIINNRFSYLKLERLLN